MDSGGGGGGGAWSTGVNRCFACPRGDVINFLRSHSDNPVPAVITADCRVAAMLCLSIRI